MLKELAVELTVVEMKLLCEEPSRNRAHQLLAIAQTGIPGEVRAKYFRDKGISTVQADVFVDAGAAKGLALHAVVRVKLTYEGDMVRSTLRTREKIGARLQEAAQEYCAQHVLEAMTGAAEG